MLVAKYRGRWKIIMRNYWWLEVIKYVGIYIKGYDLCQRIKNRIEIIIEKWIVNEILEKLWTYLIVDFIIKLLLVVGKDAILVVCNKLSKMVYNFYTLFLNNLTNSSADSSSIVITKYKLLENITSDRELQFVAELTK